MTWTQPSVLPVQLWPVQDVTWRLSHRCSSLKSYLCDSQCSQCLDVCASKASIMHLTRKSLLCHSRALHTLRLDCEDGIWISNTRSLIDGWQFQLGFKSRHDKGHLYYQDPAPDWPVASKLSSAIWVLEQTESGQRRPCKVRPASPSFWSTRFGHQSELTMHLCPDCTPQPGQLGHIITGGQAPTVYSTNLHLLQSTPHS